MMRVHLEAHAVEVDVLPTVLLASQADVHPAVQGQVSRNASADPRAGDDEQEEEDGHHLRSEGGGTSNS